MKQENRDKKKKSKFIVKMGSMLLAASIGLQRNSSKTRNKK